MASQMIASVFLWLNIFVSVSQSFDICFSQTPLHENSIIENLFTAFGGAQSWLNMTLNITPDISSLHTNTNSFIELIIMQHPNLQLLYDGSSNIPELSVRCCTRELLQVGVPGCDEPNTMIIDPNPSSIRRLRAPILAMKETTFVHHFIPLNSTDYYTFAIAHCDKRHVGSVYLDGNITMMSNGSFLQASDYRLWQFYSWWVILCCIMMFVWLTFIIRQRVLGAMDTHSNLAVTIAVLIFFIESVAWARAYSHASRTGSLSRAVQAICILISILSRTASFTVFALISCGYGIIVSSFIDIDWRIVLNIAGVFFIVQLFPTLYAIFSSESTVHMEHLSLFLPLVFIDIITLPLLLVSLYHVKTKLRIRGHIDLLNTFQWIFQLVLTLMIVLILVAGISINLAENHATTQHFDVAWLLPEALMHIKQAALIAAIAFLGISTRLRDSATGTAVYDEIRQSVSNAATVELDDVVL